MCVVVYLSCKEERGERKGFRRRRGGRPFSERTSPRMSEGKNSFFCSGKKKKKRRGRLLPLSGGGSRKGKENGGRREERRRNWRGDKGLGTKGETATLGQHGKGGRSRAQGKERGLRKEGGEKHFVFLRSM